MPSAEEHWTDTHFVARIVSTHDPVVCVKNNKLPVPKVCKEIMKADAEWNTDLKINEATCKRIFSKMILTRRDFVNEPHVFPENKLSREIHFCSTCQSHKANTQ